MAAEKTMAAPATAAVAEDRYDNLRRRLVLAVRRMCPPTLASHADDIVQEGMLRLLAAVSQHGKDAHFASSYLRAVAYSAMIDELRRVRARRATAVEEERAEETRDRSPEEATADRQLGHAIHDCLSRVAEPRRVALTLHLQGYSVPEAAELVGWSNKRTHNLVYRGLADLRECLDRKGVRR